MALAKPAFAADPGAAAFVTAIYNAYKGKDAKGVPLDNEHNIGRYFEPALATAMAKDQKAAARRNEVGYSISIRSSTRRIGMSALSTSP
jgi:hypothetical protein